MNRHFPKRPRRSGGEDGFSVGLAAVEPQRPAVRLRADADGRPASRPGWRRFLQPLPLAAALLMLLALIGYWSVYQQTTRRTQVLVAAHALPAGHIVRPSDLTTA